MAAIALLHAFPLSPESMEDLADALTDEGHEVVCPDLLAADAGYPPDPSMDAMATHVDGLMAAAGHRTYAVAGLSMGGYVAMALLRRCASRIKGLALMDTKCVADDEPASRNRLAYADRVLAEGMGWVPAATIDGLLGETTREKRGLVVKQVTKWILAADPTMVAWAQRAMAGRPDSHAELEVFRRPSVVVVGREDTLSPVPEALAMAKALGGAPLSEISGAGHLAPIECPNRVSEMLVTWASRLD